MFFSKATETNYNHSVTKNIHDTKDNIKATLILLPTLMVIFLIKEEKKKMYYWQMILEHMWLQCRSTKLN